MKVTITDGSTEETLENIDKVRVAPKGLDIAKHDPQGDMSARTAFVEAEGMFKQGYEIVEVEDSDPGA